MSDCMQLVSCLCPALSGRHQLIQQQLISMCTGAPCGAGTTYLTAALQWSMCALHACIPAGTSTSHTGRSHIASCISGQTQSACMPQVGSCIDASHTSTLSHTLICGRPAQPKAGDCKQLAAHNNWSDDQYIPLVTGGWQL
jgi:hypothetical protein